MSREAVIRQIVERDQTGQSLTEKAVLREAPDLHQAAMERFGAWDTALQYAGIDPRRLSAKQGYTQECVLYRLQRLCRDGYSLKATDCQRRDRRLCDAARQYFGDWRKALEAAGINLQCAGLAGGKARRIDKGTVMEQLRQWLAAGHSRSWMEICLQNRELAMAVKRVWGSWQRAMTVMGSSPEPDPGSRRRRWNAERVLDCLRLRHQEGKPMHGKAVSAEANGLVCAARKYFGSWRNALAAAGIEPEPRARGRGGGRVAPAL